MFSLSFQVFLITGLIQREITTGKFSILTFYERRVRRIFPALGFTSFFCIIVGYFLLLPQTYKDFGQSLAALGLFASNFMFYMESGYFAAPSSLKPLLHTWSLSVEEQFYVVMPLLLIVINLFVRKWLNWIILGFTILSTYLCILLTSTNPELSFFWPITRAWELLAGSMLALITSKESITPNKTIANLSSIAGLILLFFAYFYISEETLFPGAIALVPVLASVLLIYGGSVIQGNIIASIYSKVPFIYIGRISYSLYLVHWPIVVFYKYYSDTALTGLERISLLLISILLAHLSWQFIETPFRNRSFLSRRTILLLGASMMFLFIATGAIIAKTNGIPSRLTQDVRKASSFKENPKRHLCHQKSAKDIENNKYCIQGESDNPTHALLGDSHADALSPAISTSITKNGESVAIFTRGGCRPFIGMNQLSRQCGRFEKGKFVTQECKKGFIETCGAFNTAAFKKIKQLDIKTVVLSSRWAGQYYGTGGQSTDYCYLDDEFTECSQENNKRIFEKYLRQTLKSLNGRRVIVVGPTPEYRTSVPEFAGKAAFFNRPVKNIDRKYLHRGLAVQNHIQHIISDFPDVGYIDLYRALCPDGQCEYLANGRTLYSDSNHISLFGNKMLQQTFSKGLKQTD